MGKHSSSGFHWKDIFKGFTRTCQDTNVIIASKPSLLNLTWLLTSERSETCCAQFAGKNFFAPLKRNRHERDAHGVTRLVQMNWSLSCPQTSWISLIHYSLFLSTTEFTILSRTISLQEWVSDVGCPPFFSRWDNFWTLWARGLKLCVLPYYGNLLHKWTNGKISNTSTTLPPSKTVAMG